VSAPHRRGACPGLSAPMPTGDGLLVRLMPAEPVPPDAFAGFCEAARQYGNGTIEVSARGSLQVRGLTPHSAPLFASAVAELEIAAHEGVSIIAGPLVNDDDAHRGGAASTAVIAGLDPAIHRRKSLLAKPMDTRVKPAYDDSIQSTIARIDTAETAAELRRALGHARLILSPKVSVVVDGGGRLHLDGVPADVRLRAVQPAQQPRYHVGLAGDDASATWLGSIAPNDAVDTVVGLLTVIAEHGPTERATDILRAEGIAAFHAALAGVALSPAPSRRIPAEMVGLHPAHDGISAIGIGLAFGHAHADALADIVRIAAAHGASAVRPAPDRALLLIGVAASNAADLTTAAERLGFVVRADDPRCRIAACPGAPACASGLTPARALAAALAPTLESYLRAASGSVAVHISGCLKGCAHPAPTALTLVGTECGCGIVRNGTARATPDRYVDPANLAAEISRIAAQAAEAVHG
jgi:precorrin-3B synthase